MRFNIHARNYYDEDQILYESESREGHVDIEFGHIYALVGCNGLGKSTLIRQICQDSDTSLCNFAHNLLDDHNGRSTFARFSSDPGKEGGEPGTFYLPIDRRSGARGFGDDSLIAEVSSSFMSTGEALAHDLGPCLAIVRKELPRLRGKEIYVLLDDLDVGASLDAIADERRVIDQIARDLEANGTRFAICVAANNYELAKGLECISCADLSPVSFGSYDEYREFILSTRRWKDARDAKNLEAKRRRIRGEEGERNRKEQAAEKRARKRRGTRS